MVAHGLQMFRASLPLRLSSALVALGAFVWLLVYPTVLAAQSQRERPAPVASARLDTDFSATLTALEATLTALRGQAPPLAAAELAEMLTHGGSPVLLLPPLGLPHPTVPLATLRQRLNAQAVQVQQQMEATARHLLPHHLPEVLHQRHRDAVAQIDTALATLQQHLDAIDAAATAPQRAMAAARALAYLQAQQPRRAHQQVDPDNLPFRVPDSKVRPPRERAEEFHTALEPSQSVRLASAELLPGLLAPGVTVSPLPTPDDLAETEDLQFTDEIRALAAELAHQPVKIYTWVHDHIEFMPTYGSIQGAHMTLQTRRGNAFDTASLLIALLRASNIPARYVTGTVQIPIVQVVNWVGGVDVPEAALDLLGQGGIPSIALVQGGEIVAVKLEHVWVEAWVDFVPGRGAVHREGDTWVPLDASFKQYVYTPGMDVQTQVPFDAQTLLIQATQGATLNAQEGWVQALHQANINTVLHAYQAQVQRLVEEHTLPATQSDGLGVRAIIPATRPVLAASLPYRVLVTGVRNAMLPIALRHHVTVALYTSETDRAVENPTIQYTLSLPALNTQRLGVTYAPATTTDQSLLASYAQQQASSLPVYLLRVIPELQLDGRTVVTGPADQMGRPHWWSVTLRAPQERDTRTEYFPGRAGDALVFGVNGNGLTKAVLQARLATSPSATAAENLHTVSLVYWIIADLADRLAAPLSSVAIQRLPSVGLFAAPLHVTSLLGVPYTGFYRARRMDIARTLLAVAGNDAARVLGFRTQSGWQNAYLEGAVFDLLFGYPPGASISAVQLLQEANTQGIPLYTLTTQTLHGALPQLQLDLEVLQDIRVAVGQGYTVLVSSREVDRAPWSGVGYVIQDPATGAGAYLIQGGLRGGIEGGCREEQVEPDQEVITEIVFSIILFIVLVVLIVALINALPVLAPVLAGAGIMALAFDVSPAIAASVPPGEPGLWRVLFASQYGPFRHTAPFPGEGIGKPPGTCTDQQYRLFRDAVDHLCDDFPGNRECIRAAQQKDCAVAQRCAFNSFACINARVILMFECFGGGDKRHWNEVSNRLRGLGKCVDCLVENGCSNPFMPF